MPPAPQTGQSTHDDDPAEIVARARELACGNADEATLAFLASQIEGITERYEQDGPQGLWGQTKSLRSLGHTLLAGQQPPAARRELFRITARASGLLGYMAVNTGAFPLAEAYCAEALELSRAIGDLDTELWADGTRSFAAYYAGRYTEADARAAAAVNRAPDHPQAIRLLVNGRARALGKLGDRNQAERVIGQAMDLSDRYDVVPGLTSCISFLPYGRARTMANALTARVALQDTGHVLRDAELLDDLVEKSGSAWSRSLVRLDVATAVLQQRAPDVEHAMSLGQQAITLASPLPISSVRQRSRDLYERAAPWRTRPAVREYGEQLRFWGCRLPPAEAG
jgi:tetratricopeptide (TPR) repeat protein